MPEAIEIARAYIDTWNEADPSRRARLLQQHWTPQARYTDPLMQATGADRIGDLVAAVHGRFPGFRFALTGTPDGHGAFVRLSWALGPEGVEAPIEGSDVIRLDDGRIGEVIGFLDRVPPAT
jgi:hypothetical protein